ncbi:MAG: efflux RND transporter periplasmic adaptor subunit [Deltaproteobacteria bacterium]|nr:efflux RND transporter periplasmic adaptor subunit [Candidatus Zymogenaceae bacterium]
MEKKTYVKIGAAVIIVLMIVLAIVRFVLNHTPQGFPPGFAPGGDSTPVAVSEVSPGTIKDTLFYTGDIHALAEAEVYSVAAGTIISYHCDEGDAVRKGQILVTLQRQETWDVYMPVTVRAPISGIVARNYLDAGELATESTPLVLIVAGDEMKAVIKVPEGEMSKIRLGMKAELTVPSVEDHVFTGEVSEISPVLDTDTRTCRMAILFENEGMSLVAGMFGYVSVIVEEKTDVVCVPALAVLYDEEGRKKPYCFVIEDDTAHHRSLEIGIVSDDLIEVLSGVEIGERVVVSGQEGLEDGGLVIVTE